VQVFRPINPKAVTRNELYGYLHPQTREWKEGLVSDLLPYCYHCADLKTALASGWPELGAHG